MWDHSYCRVPSQQPEHDRKLRVKKQFGLLGMETTSPVTLENLLTDGIDRYFYFQTISSDQDLLFVEAISIEPSSRCLPTKLVPKKSLCLFRILHDPKGSEQSPQRTFSMVILVTLAWSSQLPYPEAIIISIQQPILLTWRRDILENPKGEIHPLVQNKTLKLVAKTVLGIDYKKKVFQGSLPALPLNQEDLGLTQIMNRSGVNGIADSFCSNINQILKFLSQPFQYGIQYRTINNYRSAITFR